MAENTDLANVPQATSVPKKRMRFSVVWIIPLVAALVSLGIAVHRFLSEGPTITITFRAAQGVVAGKTFVKFKDINIGQVTAVRLSDDYSKIVMTAKIDKHAEGLIVEDAKFWVEAPRVTLSGISGIGTLLSGNYIGVEPGKSHKKGREFIGLEVPPVITGGQPGREFVLRADDLGSLGIGSPLYYRHLNVGQVIGYDLARDGRSLDIKVFVNGPYDRYVTPDTRFWQASGIDVSVGAGGFSVQTQSVLSILIGGIVFERPPDASAAEPAAANTAFMLYSDRRAAFALRESVIEHYVLHFKESLRGVSVGAPVNLLGLPVGEVTEVGLEFDPATGGVGPRVVIAIYPDRFVAHLQKSAPAGARPRTLRERRAFVQRLIDQGLRAQLQIGSLLSGQLYVALDYFPDAPKAKIDWRQEPPELPVVPGGLAPFEKKILNVLTKLEQLPLEDISRDVKKVLETLDQALKDVSQIANRVDGEVVPQAEKTLEDLRRSIGAAQRVLANTETTLVGPDAAAQQDLRDALQEIARAARGIRVLADYLERNPNALIRGKTQEKP